MNKLQMSSTPILALMFNAKIYYWTYEDGTPDDAFGHPGINPPIGWHCWAYPDNDEEFEKWMSQFCPTSEYTHRFNSGDPMYTVFIKDKKEATMFALKFEVCNGVH